MSDSKPANHGNTWSKVEVAQLKKEAKQDVPTTKIAKTHKRTEASVRAKAQSEGISLKRPN